MQNGKESSIQQTAIENKIFGFSDSFAMWFSLGVGLLVIQMGSFLAGSIGTQQAALAIIIGSIIGGGILAYGARIGQISGLNSAGLMVQTFGNNFGKLPIVLNIIQLLGWTAFEIVIICDGTIAIGERAFGIPLDGLPARIICASIWGAIIYVILSFKMTSIVKNLGARFVLPIVMASLLWLTYQFGAKLSSADFAQFWNNSGNGEMSMYAAMDLVIAMPISWLPLIADYSRFGKDKKTTTSGTFLGYVAANIWCYGLGFLIASSAKIDAGMVATILLAQGGIVALGIILIDEADNAYGDAYSGSVNIGALLGMHNSRAGGISIVIFCTLAAIFLPMHDLEKFLLILSSIFIPLYAVILGQFTKSKNWRQNNISGFDPAKAAIWILGIAMFHLIVKYAPNIGASLPTFIIIFGLSFIISQSSAKQDLSLA